MTFSSVRTFLLPWLLPLLVISISACSEAPQDSPTPETPTLEPATQTGLVEVQSPFEGEVVLTESLALLLTLGPDTNPETLEVRIDGTLLTEGLTWDAQVRQVKGAGIPHAAGRHVIEVSVRNQAGLLQILRRSYTARPGGAGLFTIQQASQRIDGPASLSRSGDFLLANDRVQFVVQNVGRNYYGMVNFGGHLIDADRVRLPWELERDQVDGLTPGINFEDTSHPTAFTVVSDGADGGPAILELKGPDDLLETFNISSLATLSTPAKVTSIPLSADDRDLPIQVVERYTLEPGSDTLIWETEIQSESSQAISFYFGDYVNASSRVEFFSPGDGMGVIAVRRTCEWLGFLSVDATDDYAFGYMPELATDSSIVSLQGINFPVIGQDALNVMLGLSPPAFRIDAGGTLTFKRFLVMGRDLGAISDARIRIRGLEAGTVGGVVTQAGVPVLGARVAAVRMGLAGSEVVAHWVTDAQGKWGGKLEPDTYTLYAGLPGAPNPLDSVSGTSPSPTRTVRVNAGSSSLQDFDFPSSAKLRVTLIDERGAPVPGRVSVVGFDPSPDPVKNDEELGKTVRAVLSDPDWDPMPFGLLQALFIGPNGDSGEVKLEPGDYALVASRGVEYATTQQRVTLVGGQTTDVQIQLARVIDSPGFVSGDFHVHSIDSWDAPISRELRATTLLAEGLDLFVATDHTIRMDYTDVIAELGGADLVASFIGEEITSFDIGHYNIFPAQANATSITQGAVDWVGESPAGQGYPSSGAYDLTPSQLYAAALSDPGVNVLQLNHPNNLLHGLFSLHGVDTAMAPPQNHMPLTLFRQDPTQLNFFSPQWTAMELWRGYADDQDFFFEENIGDYFNLLNQGIVRSAMANSDTHSSVETPTGGPRTFVGLGDLSGTALAASGELLATAINEGRTFGTNGPFVSVSLQTSQGEASLRPGLPRLIGTPEGAASVEIQVQSPAWAPFDEIAVYFNNAPYPMPDDDDAPGMDDYQGQDLSALDVPRYEVAPDVRLLAGVDFVISQVAPFEDIPDATRLEAAVSVPLENLTQDTWVVVTVRGTAGVSAALFPVMPAHLERENNITLDDLLDGNVGEEGVLSLAYTSPLFLDVDGNGVYDPPGVRLSEPPAEARWVRKVRAIAH